MNVLKILIVILVLTIIILGIETIIKLKNDEGKLIDEVRKPLIVRIDILIILIIILSIISIINILINK